MEPTAWIAAFAEALGVEPPDEATVQQLLDTAAVAAHASQRWAAPIACYLVGLAGHAGFDPQGGTAAARAVTEG